MSLLLKICEVANEKYLESNSPARFKAIIEDPRIFTMVTDDDKGQQVNHGFYHVCNPRLLLASLMAGTFTGLEAFNQMLNAALAKIVTVKVTNVPEYNKVTTCCACAKCGLKIPGAAISKLAIIENVRKITHR